MYSGGFRFNPLVLQHSLVDTGHKIISNAIFSLPLIQVRQLSVTGEKQVNHLGLSLPRKSVARFTDHLDMIIVVDWDVKQHSN